jgi:D-2-hydroxyacid dehydrogenase (NADP+)
MTSSIKLLMSQKATHRLRGSIQDLAGRVAPNIAIHFVSESSRAADLAFVSRDVTGLSTKQRIATETQKFYDALSASPDLKWVNIHSAGMDRSIYQELAARGVSVTTSQGTNSKIVAQMALGGLLALSRKLPFLAQAQAAHEWAPLQGAHMPRDLAHQTAVIIGWGAIAQQLAQYLSMLEVTIVVVRQQGDLPAGPYETLSLKQWSHALPRADWLIVACPLTKETHGLVDEAALKLLPRSSFLINIARGQIVEEAALVASLQASRLAGAFLDVFEYEPLSPGSPLWDLPNVILTAHSAGFSSGNEARVDDLFLRRLGKWLGERLT